VRGKRKGPGRLIKLVIAGGLLFSIAICAALILLALHPQRDSLSGDRFHRSLRDYDRIFEAGEGEDLSETLGAMLDKIEKEVQGVESWLSLLKRRRALAKAQPRMLPRYQEACRRAAAAFPWSEPLAALALACGPPAGAETAGAAGTAGNTGSPGKRQSPRDYGALINDTRLIPLVLAAAVLRGDFSDPAGAAENRGETLLSVGLPLIRPGLPADQGDRLIVNLALLRIIRQDYLGAEAQLQGLSRSNAQGAFLGEYYYDFGDPLRAAEIFNRAGGEKGLLRSADALWLGGKTENAGNIWRIQSGEELDGTGELNKAGELRSLYNLAASFPEEREKRLGRLYRIGTVESALREEPAYVYGLIAYTRDLPPYEALETLEDRLRDLKSPDLAALRDLEILRRRGELWTLERTAAEAWLLLDTYPEDPRLYRWGAWYFAYQRRREEGAILVKTAGYRGVRDPWLDLGAALIDLEEGRLDQAEEKLRSIISSPGPSGSGPSGPGPIWQAEANLGLILEARRAPAEALGHYEIAGARVEDRRAASRLQLRIAGCLRSLGRKEESRRALLYSLDLNPGNLAARLELRRLEEE
jgi:hypothetical protein